MRAFVLAHVDQLRGFLDSAKRRFNRRVRTSDQGHDRPVRRRARIDIEQRNALGRFNRVRDLPNYVFVASFRKIRHAFDQLLHAQSRGLGCIGMSILFLAAKSMARE